ncbi:cell wall-binding repeat-containing protein [Janibacter melonis]|nr:cell wall-binding repeat-containing protein [Janibacter melonis]MCM3554231.1 cell wall-binding repeat-containing protein [Janibacter melonis]
MISPRTLPALLLAAVLFVPMAAPTSAAPPGRAPAADAAVVVPAQWQISGSGFGHGVGMSQYGAKHLADEGWSARQILAHYYAGTTYDAVPDTQQVAVSLEQSVAQSRLVGRATASGGGTLTLTAGSRTVSAPGGATVVVTRSGSSVVASCSSCSWAPLTGSSITVTTWAARTDLEVSGSLYRYGRLVLTPSAGAGVHAVLWVRLHDEYLDQIREVPWSWPSSALQAQAAAARAYAMRKISAGLRPECACHVTDTVADQVFHPVPTGGELAAWPRWQAAVRATGSSSTGYVPRYGGQVIEALYSSSNGGWSLDGGEVFGAARPYLRSRYDPASLGSENPYRSWTRTISQSSLAAAFGLPDVVRLDLSDRATGHAVATARATSSGGTTATLTGVALRQALGLPSTALRRADARTSGAGAPGLAVAIARSVPTSATSVVLASQYEQDALHALVAQPLAGTLDAPLLLTGRRGLGSATTAELDRRGSRVRTAYVVGGPATVEDGVLRALRSRGLVVVRLGGSDVDSVAAAVLQQISARRTVRAVAVTTTTGRSAGAAFSGTARRLREPVVVAGSTQLPWRTRAAVGRAGVTSAHLLGGTAHVSEAVDDSLTGAGLSTVRLSGDDDAQVAGRVGEHFVRSVGGTEVVLAPAGATRVLHRAVAGGLGEVVLVGAAPLPGATAAALQRAPSWTRVRAVGTTQEVPTAWLWAARES